MSMSDASGNGQISTINTGKWLKRLDQTNMSYFCWSLTNKNESSALLAPGNRKMEEKRPVRGRSISP